LSGDDVFDWHGFILTPPQPSPNGEGANTPLLLERGRGRGHLQFMFGDL